MTADILAFARDLVAALENSHTHSLPIVLGDPDDMFIEGNAAMLRINDTARNNLYGWMDAREEV
ncbi:hypothetical protein ABZ319_23640 [Nocardia sp. NPDC005978]|uniref:hypothetical protein n=1 Tax=Nocardia sp. NPDC005978 TaxID=3156725 RepID=UPI0033BB4806